MTSNSKDFQLLPTDSNKNLLILDSQTSLKAYEVSKIISGNNVHISEARLISETRLFVKINGTEYIQYWTKVTEHLFSLLF